MDLDLIASADFGSDGSGPKGARGGGADRRKPSSAAALRGSSPDLAKLGRPEVKSTRIWVWGDLRGTCSPPGDFAGLGVVRGGVCRDDGGPARRGIAGERGRGT